MVPVNDVPSQTFTMQLGGQNCTISVQQTSTAGVGSDGTPIVPGLFLDLLVDRAPVVQGVACENLNRIVRDAYRGFVGDLAWVDTQGSSDPQTPGLGARYQLFYLEAVDVAGRGP